MTAVLIGLTAAILGYCLISALNASATYQPQALSFVYHKHVLKWLPHSLDSASTWSRFRDYLALACAFLAVRDWLFGKSDREQRADYVESTGSRSHMGVPDRLRGLLWVMAVNGGLLALEGIVQRLEGSGNLLFLLKPRINQAAEAQFGPYAYRGNAAAYFNLLWPVCLGFWWTLQRSREGGRRHHLLLLCAGPHGRLSHYLLEPRRGGGGFRAAHCRNGLSPALQPAPGFTAAPSEVGARPKSPVSVLATDHGPAASISAARL